MITKNALIKQMVIPHLLGTIYEPRPHFYSAILYTFGKEKPAALKQRVLLKHETSMWLNVIIPFLCFSG